MVLLITFEVLKRLWYILLLMAVLVPGLSFKPAVTPDVAGFALDYASLRYKKEFSDLVYIGALRQKLYLIKNYRVEKVYDISTSRNGCGMENKSEKTPLGLHRVHKKVGDKTPLGGILSGMRFTGKMAYIEQRPVPTGNDDVTTRAIRLEGAEPGYNKGGQQDSFLREIYIHGTPEEGLIGQPVSHGCVRMRNTEVIDLFDQVKEGMYVLILEN